MIHAWNPAHWEAEIAKIMVQINLGKTLQNSQLKK
jgi:hypothetical protein